MDRTFWLALSALVGVLGVCLTIMLVTVFG
jgi:hypothetical protein